MGSSLIASIATANGRT